MIENEEKFIPLQVGDECEYFSSMPSGTTAFKCTVAKVFHDGVSYYLKEIPENGETECKNRDAIFTDNPEHVRTFEHDYGDIETFKGCRGIRNIRRKQ